MKRNAAAFVSGLIFAIGLGVSGMTRPEKVIGFLDISGAWDPSLIFVMVGAIGVHFLAYRAALRWIRIHRSPLFAKSWHIPDRRDLNSKLLFGSAIFGIGWGLAGYCPGPALTSLAGLRERPFLFVVNMVAGLLIYRWVETKSRAPNSGALAFVTQSPDFTEIREDHGVAIDLRYASSNNFTGENVYGEFDRAFLHRLAALKLVRAVAALSASHPHLKFLILDALRPRSAQRRLWAHVVGTADEDYIANPNHGSVHNYGFALDLTLVDGSGRELDMGSGFDEFVEASEPRHELRLFAEGRLTELHLANRNILRGVMLEAGFLALDNEWWHFDALEAAQLRKGFQIVE